MTIEGRMDEKRIRVVVAKPGLDGTIAARRWWRARCATPGSK
jgi:hypothetical protein